MDPTIPGRYAGAWTLRLATGALRGPEDTQRGLLSPRILLSTCAKETCLGRPKFGGLSSQEGDWAVGVSCRAGRVPTRQVWLDQRHLRVPCEPGREEELQAETGLAHEQCGPWRVGLCGPLGTGVTEKVSTQFSPHQSIAFLSPD
jgi:hypothetical protein